MGTGLPFFKSRLVRSGVAAATNLCRNFKPWDNGGVVWIRGVVAGRAVAVFALNTFQLGSNSRTDEPGRNAITNRMAGQTARVRILINLLETSKSLGMQRIHDGVVDLLVAFNTRLRTYILRCGTQNAEQSI
jgi:hypothetical protein